MNPTVDSASTSTEQFFAVGEYSDGSQRFLTASVTWKTLSPNVATISNTPGQQGLATILAKGSTEVTASLNSFIATTTLTGAIDSKLFLTRFPCISRVSSVEYKVEFTTQVPDDPAIVMMMSADQFERSANFALTGRSAPFAFFEPSAEAIENEACEGEACEGELCDSEAASPAIEAADDPVRAYMRQMGNSPLLSREHEIALARTMEAGRNNARRYLSRSPMMVREMLLLGEALAAGQRDAPEVLRFDEYCSRRSRRAGGVRSASFSSAAAWKRWKAS